MTRNKDITSCRGTLEFLRGEADELLTIDKEVDNILEVAGITKALDNGPALLFQNVKGYPGHRIVSNLLARMERAAKIFDAADIKDLKLKAVKAFKNPVPPVVIARAPCQEIVITKNIDVLQTLPIIKHTETDPGRILGGGIVFLSGADVGTCVSYKRTHFQGKDWASMAFQPGGHFEQRILELKGTKAKLPLTINISPSPAVQILAAGGVMPLSIPLGSDELGIAGGLQGAPVAICKAKTVDAYAIANSEWVIEGYVDTAQKVWESREAEQKKDFSTPFFPEYHGYEGRARQTYKFQATAITRRKDNPIFNTPLAHSFEPDNLAAIINHALLYDLFNRQWPGLVIDVNALHGMKMWNGLVIQVDKRRRRDEEHITNLILAAWAACAPLRTVVVVDEDVNIYNADEIMWALNTRVNAKENLILVPPGVRVAGSSGEVRGPAAPVWRMGFDATVPFGEKWRYYRGEYPKVNLGKWLTKAQVAKIRAAQSDYARLLAERRS